MFRRGISGDFVTALSRLAESGGANWWSEVLADPDLIVAIRHEYLNVYWQGQSLFHVGFVAGAVRPRTHPKYLLDPSAKTLVALDGDRFALPSPDTLLTGRWEPGATLGKLKKSAGLYAGEEKAAVHAIVRANPGVIDVEVALRREEPGDEHERSIPRLDLLCLEPDGERVRLAFWEVKLFGNPELRARAPNRPAVLGQIEDYGRILEAERANVLDSYRTVAKNLRDIADMRPGSPGAGALVGRVADAPDLLTLGTPPGVGLVVTGFDADQRDGKVWAAHHGALANGVPNGRTRFVGDPSGVRL